MHIYPPKLVREGEQVKLTALVDYAGGTEDLWYAVDRDYGEFLTIEKLDAFVVGLLLFAMKHNEDLHIHGTLSEKLFYNLSHSLIKILTLLIPSLHPIKLLPEDLDNGKQHPTVGGVATGFSGGIDSFCTFIDHFNANTPNSYRLTHLVLNNVGSHGWGGRSLFQKRYQRLLDFAQEVELPLIKIDSNLHDVLDMEFRNTHAPRNVSAILTLQKLFGKYLYASAHKYTDCFIGEAEDGAVIDPAAIHLLSTETTESISTGCQYSRVEKTMKVAEFEPSYRYLDICVHAIETAENCSTCWKCARTLLTLDILGKRSLYDQVFNLEKFNDIKAQYLQTLLLSEKPLEKEVIELAKLYNYDLENAVSGGEANSS